MTYKENIEAALANRKKCLDMDLKALERFSSKEILDRLQEGIASTESAIAALEKELASLEGVAQ